jgi:TonB-linked SusC/RagA family outer membrane protein
MVIAGTNLGALTNQSGRYLIQQVPLGEQEVRAILLGFGQQTQTITVAPGQTAVVDFSLSMSAIQLEGLVVNVATGREQRARELGTNVGTVELEAVEIAPITSVSDLLSGRTEGLILQDVNGTTGTAQRIRIRGANSLSLSNEPLVYIDGILANSSMDLQMGVGGQETSRLNDLNLSDIEKIEVVKGPAASALYGTAAANGVLLITTKQGMSGPAEWNYYVEAGQLEDVANYPKNYLAYGVIGDPNAPFFNTDGSFNSDDYERCPNRYAAAGLCSQDGYVSFDGVKDPRTTFFSTGARHRYGVNVRGGSDYVNYFLSGELQDETGVIKFNTQDRVTVRANLNAEIRPDLDVSVTSSYTQNNLALNNNDNSIFSPILNGLLSEAYFIPADPADPPGEVNRRNYGFGFNMTDLGYLPSYQDVDRVILGSKAQYRPLPWLSLNASGGMDLVSRHDYETLQPGLLPIAESYEKGYRDSRRTSEHTYTANFSAIGRAEPRPDIFTTTTIGGSYIQEKMQRNESYGSSLVPGTSSCGTTAALFAVDEDYTELRTIGGYIQQEVAWRDKVFLSGAIRGDDNSAFGADFGFVLYPSASVSWVIGEEEWFPTPDFLSALRLRTAWGTSGLRPGMRDAVTLYAPITVARGGGDVAGITLGSTGNQDLEPEKSTEIELGFDAAFFDNRVGVDFTYFNKHSKDALISRRLPPSYGLTATRFENLGEVKNSGTELAVDVTVLDKEDIGLDLGFTHTTLHNEVLALGEGVEDITFNRGLQRHAEGYPAGGFWQPKVSWNDPDGDGLLTNDNVTIAEEASYIGPSLPTWQSTFSASLRLWDWLGVSSLFEARGGNYTGNDSQAFQCSCRSTRGCSAVGNPNASTKDQAAYIADRYLGSMYGYVEKADFAKWRELAVTLTAPRYLIDKVRQLEGLTLTLAGRNLATWTDYPGIDPEAVEGGGNANFSQSEFNTQPPVQHLMVRLNYALR